MAYQDLAELFALNAQAIKHYSVWKNDLAKRLAALLFTIEKRTVDLPAIQAAEAAIKRRTGVFSPLRGNAALAIAAMLALSAEQETFLERILSGYDLFRQNGFRSSDYLAVSACLAARDTPQESLIQQIARARDFFRGMKKQHPFIVGQDDYVFATLLALTDLDQDTALHRVEKIYDDLRYDFRPRGSVYQLCQVLALDSQTVQRADRVRQLRDAFRAAGLKLDKTYTMVSLGVLSYASGLESDIVGHVQAICTYLRQQKGLGSFVVGKNELLLTATTLVACALLQEQSLSLATSVVSSAISGLIIAQQAAVIAATAGASAAASSAGR